MLQMAPDQYLLGEGPFSLSVAPVLDRWSVFHPPFFLSESDWDKWYIPSSTGVFSRKQLLVFLKDQRTAVNIFDRLWEEPSFSFFKDFFLSAQEQIKQNKIQKVVPVFFEIADYSLREQEIPEFIHRLVVHSDRGRGGVVYAFWSGSKALMGITPEHLFRKEALYIQTMALAGTARGPQHDLLKDSKEKWEHELVVKEMKCILTPLGEQKLSDTYVYSIRNIRHLRTDFKLQLKSDISFKRICRLLHPTPALGGFPKKPALDLLLELQEKKLARHHFGAPFGVVKGNKTFCVAAIRNIQFVDGKAYLGSGCGLVKDSRLEREWKELKMKRQIIKNILF